MYLISRDLGGFMKVVKSSFRAECVLIGLIPIAVPAENVSSKTDGRSVRLAGTGVVYCRKQWVERSGWLVGSMQGIWGLF